MHNLQGIMHNSLFRVNFNISRISVTNILDLKLTEIKNSHDLGLSLSTFITEMMETQLTPTDNC